MTKTKNAPVSLPVEVIERRIYLIRGYKVMLDADLAALYEVVTKVFNQAVRRNRERFPADFMFQLTARESAALRSQIVTSNVSRGGRRYLPYVFTQEGVAMLSGVLNSARAMQVNIAIMRAFVRIRELAAGQQTILRKLSQLEHKYEQHDSELKAVFEALRKLMGPPQQRRRRIGFV